MQVNSLFSTPYLDVFLTSVKTGEFYTYQANLNTDYSFSASVNLDIFNGSFLVTTLVLNAGTPIVSYTYFNQNSNNITFNVRVASAPFLPAITYTSLTPASNILEGTLVTVTGTNFRRTDLPVLVNFTAFLTYVDKNTITFKAPSAGLNYSIGGLPFITVALGSGGGGGGAVSSVAGRIGVVTLVKADVGLENVDNTSDLLKPISTATQSALNLKADASQIVVTPESLSSFVGNQAVLAGTQRSVTVMGVLTAISSKTARTTGATFNLVEAANWNYISQSTIPSFVPSTLILIGFQVLESGSLYQSVLTRTTGTAFDATENVTANWTPLSSSGVGTRVNVSNLSTNGNILTAATSVDIATTLNFIQTTSNISATLLNPTSAANHKVITLENNGTVPLNIISTGDQFTLVNGQSLEVWYNGTAWRLFNPAQVVAETGVVTLPSQFIQVSAAFTDVTGLSLMLPSGGKYELIVSYMVRNSVANAPQRMQVLNGALTVLDIVEARVPNANSTTYQEITRVIQYTGVTSELIKVQLASDGTSSAQLMSDLIQGQTKIAWKKIAGFSPIIGQSVDRKFAFKNLNQSGITTTGVDIIFDGSGNGNIPLNTTTGVFTLTAGKEYELESMLAIISNSGTAVNGYMRYEWVDAVNNLAIPFGNLGVATVGENGTANANNSSPVPAKVIFTPTTDQTVKVRITGIVLGGSSQFVLLGSGDNRGTSYAKITQIGTRAITFPALGGANIGDAKNGFQATDHMGWIMLDGRLLTTLTASQRANATILGFVGNLPNAAGRSFIQGTLGAQLGSASIAQNQLPNVAPTATSNNTLNVGTLASNTFQSFGGVAWITGGTVAYGMNAPVIGSINGNVTQQPFTPLSIGTNSFIYLGLS
jgi:hypothetical protein